ncbi:tryptophan--tRNA ligase [Orrella sp. 11846]|uniref:tryptophan--tRNA ligase n=1 Tax=Orrella sp. 11846 TaxID=3409913 RepID=UPI003B5C9878
MKTRVLTGITTTGIPHLGNYVGAIRPAIRASQADDVDAFFFLADYHALVKCDEPQRIAESRLAIAATWLAAGLDTNKVTFYRQSDIPEIPQLSWMLTCVTAKGLMNRAHAYKGSVDQNREKGLEDDDGITMGLFSYPILMAADILMFNANKVPVGRDQVQHLEMARDIAQRFNYLYASESKPLFVLPEAVVDEAVAILPGLDGRKMSKSYGNTIPLFEGGSRRLQETVSQIVTDSRLPGEPKDAHDTHMFPIFQAFATEEETAQFVQDLKEGLGWGEAKKRLVQVVEREIEPLRVEYESLMTRPDDLEDILQAGAAKAREISAPMIEAAREAVGLCGVSAPVVSVKKTKQKAKLARLVTYRDEDGQFRLKLFSATDETLAISLPVANPRDLGAVTQQLKQPSVEICVDPTDEKAYQVMNGSEVLAQGMASDSVQTRDVLMAATQVAIVQLQD